MNKKSEIVERMEELFRPIEQQILMTDDTSDILILASIMITTSKRLYESILGKEDTKLMLLDWAKNWDYDGKI